MYEKKLSDELTLKRKALRIRSNIIREIVSNHGGHIGGSFDLAEVLAVIYSDFARVKPEDPNWKDRDFVILSKGHAGPALYAALALEVFFTDDKLDNLNNSNSILPGHCDRLKVPGVDATTGSLGQGLSIACGVALGGKLSASEQKVFCITGDGESDEGQIWEAALFAAHFKLDNLIAFLDWNKKQIDGLNEEVMSLGDPKEKYKSFGWDVYSVKGNDVTAIQNVLLQAYNSRNGKPSMIILDTVKGEGSKIIMEMTNNHCIAFSDELKVKVLSELNRQAFELGIKI